MANIPQQRISVAMALDALREQTEETKAAEQHYREVMRVRNVMIREARRAGVWSKVIERITGLSRDRIARIAAQPAQVAYGSDRN